MSQSDPDARFGLEPHEYRSIAAPLRRKKAKVEVIVVSLVLAWFVVALVIWPVGVMVNNSMREAIYPPFQQFRHALEPAKHPTD